jgi:hypothetical protein
VVSPHSPTSLPECASRRSSAHHEGLLPGATVAVEVVPVSGAAEIAPHIGIAGHNRGSRLHGFNTARQRPARDRDCARIHQPPDFHTRCPRRRSHVRAPSTSWSEH